MSRKKTARRRRTALPRAGESVQAVLLHTVRTRARARGVIPAAVSVAMLLAVALYATHRGGAAPRNTQAMSGADEAVSYVGAQACASCHEQQAKAWRGSQHELAMQHAGEKSVLGNFGDSKF